MGKGGAEKMVSTAPLDVRSIELPRHEQLARGMHSEIADSRCSYPSVYVMPAQPWLATRSVTLTDSVTDTHTAQ